MIVLGMEALFKNKFAIAESLSVLKNSVARKKWR
jgi:hypothetical protein